MSTIAVQETSDQAPTAGPGPLPRRIVDTFFSPGELFARFGPDAPWGLPLLIATVLSAAAFLLLPAEVLMEQMREQMARQGEAAAAGPSPEAMAGITRGIMVGSNFLMIPLMAFLTAGILTLVFRVVMGGEAGFRQYLAVVCHATLVGAVGSVITVGLMAASGDMQTQLSLALLVPGLERETFAFRFLNAMNVFTLWQVALYAVGAAVMNRRIPMGRAAVVLYGLLVAIVAFFAFLAGLFGG